MKPLDNDSKGRLWGVPGFFKNERRARGDILCIGAACQNIMLAAESFGLGSCMMLYPLIADEDVRELLDIRFPWEIMAYIPLGRPAAERPRLAQTSKNDTNCRVHRFGERVMTREEVIEKVKECIVESVGVKYEEIELTSQVVNDLGADSLDLVALLYQLETEFDISLQRGAIMERVTARMQGEEFLDDAGMVTEPGKVLIQSESSRSSPMWSSRRT